MMTDLMISTILDKKVLLEIIYAYTVDNSVARLVSRRLYFLCNINFMQKKGIVV